jgi:hypothetical protein
MTGSKAEGAPAAALLAALLLALLALAERAGLPLPYVRGFLLAAALLTYGAIVTLARTGRERLFIGLDGAAGPVQAGLAVAAAAWLAGQALSPQTDPAGWIAAMAGALLGVVAAHAVERFAARRPGGDGEPAGWPGLLAAFASITVGGLVLVAGLGSAEREFARILGLTAPAALALAALLILLPTLLGGARGAMALAGASAAAAAVILAALTLIGLAWLGALPIPGQSEGRTLQAIAEVRERWGIRTPVHLTAWPPLDLLLRREALSAFAAAFATAAAIGLAAAPAAPLLRRATAGSAAVACLLLPLLTTAIAGYAIEAAGTRFVGAPAARPPAALVETAALGLVHVCGRQPATADELRLACGIAPRDPTVLDWGRLSPTTAYLESGLPAALGFPATISLAADGLRLAMALAAGALGLWIAARAIGRGLLGRRRQAAGLASLRQGLIRVAALAFIGGIGALIALRIPLPSEAAYALPAAAALLAAARLWSVRRARLPASPVPPPAPRRRASRDSALGEAT